MTVRPLAAYRHLWLPELTVLAIVAIGSVALFAMTDLDIAAARPFFDAGGSDPWPVAGRAVWKLLYASAPWITGSLAVLGAAALVAGFTRERLRRFRMLGAFVLLSVALGPGLVVNGILKDHWGRPRPRQVEVFNGLFPYVAPLVPASTPGRSFPCGHCSVGYLYGLGWWIWRRRRPRLAAASLAIGLGMGTLLGLGRLVAGAHFISDTVWSAIFAYAVAHALYYYVLRVPAREDAVGTLYPLFDRKPWLRRSAIAAAIVFTLGIIVGGIAATPHDRDLGSTQRLSAIAPRPEVFELVADTLDVEIRIVASPADLVDIKGHIYGFGLPGNELNAAWETQAAPNPTLRYRVTARGWFPDIDGLARIRVPAGAFETIRVRIRRGDIVVIDAAAGTPGPSVRPKLDLLTGDGEIRKPAP